MAATTVVSLVLLLASLLQADAECVSKKAGDTNGYRVPLARVQLPPPYTSWDVHVPNPCAPHQKVGVDTSVCDPDGRPEINIIPFDHIIVTRHDYPYPMHNATADITVYCSYYGSQSSKDTVDSIRAVPVQQ